MANTTYELWPTANLHNIIDSLDLAGAGFGGDFTRGWAAALAALRVAIGAPVPAQVDHAPAPCSHVHDFVPPVILDVTPRYSEPAPSTTNPPRSRIYDGIEDFGACAMMAFHGL